MMSRWLTKGNENISHVILNLFQDLKRSQMRRSRNEFGMTGWVVRDETGDLQGGSIFE